MVTGIFEETPMNCSGADPAALRQMTQVPAVEGGGKLGKQGVTWFVWVRRRVAGRFVAVQS